MLYDSPNIKSDKPDEENNYLAHSAEVAEDDDLHDAAEFIAFSIRQLEGYGVWDGGATRSVGGSQSVQPVVDMNPDTLLDATDVGFTFAGGESADANTVVTVPHPSFDDGLVVNVVANDSTPILLGLDNIRRYGLVLDYHHNTVYSHVLKRWIPCVVLPTGHLGSRLYDLER